MMPIILIKSDAKKIILLFQTRLYKQVRTFVREKHPTTSYFGRHVDFLQFSLWTLSSVLSVYMYVSRLFQTCLYDRDFQPYRNTATIVVNPVVKASIAKSNPTANVNAQT